MKLDDLIATAAADLDVSIDRLLRALAAIWQEEAATAGPPDPLSDWRHATPAESLQFTRARLAAWREQSLALLAAKIHDIAPYEDVEDEPIDEWPDVTDRPVH
jgi:hypothetical protein